MILEEAIKQYGENNQKIVAIEELSELQKAISKDLRGLPDYENIAEEIADVEIMIAQLKMIYKNNPEITYFREQKMKRLEKRLNGNANCDTCRCMEKSRRHEEYGYCKVIKDIVMLGKGKSRCDFYEE